MRRADLSLTVTQRKLRCVIDPTLALGHAQGAALAQRLTQVMEPWLPRSFWQMLDASELLLHSWCDPVQADDKAAAPAPSPQALSDWSLLRETTDAGSWSLRWVGDRLAESQLQDALDATLIDRFELLAEALALRWERHRAECGRPQGLDVAGASLDTFALSVALDDALVLCACGPAGPPWLARAAQRVDLAVEGVDPEGHPLLSAERQVVRLALASAGLATLLTRQLPLAVLHMLPADETVLPGDVAPLDPFDRATVWWYPL